MTPQRALDRYKLRISRKRLLWRGFRKRRELSPVQVDRSAIRRADILCFVTVRNEATRLPFFLEHYRKLGVGHFLIVSNDSSDGTDDFLGSQPDVSLWTTSESYKAARFGVDWLTWLQRKFAHGKWTLTVDADELLIYPDWEHRDLSALTAWLDRQKLRSFGAMMLDLYPKGSPDAVTYAPGDDPVRVLDWFDPTGYWSERRGRHQAICQVGGVRARCFFQDTPQAAPVLSKVPLIKWHRSYVYFSSMHVALPTWLNEWHDGPDQTRTSGVLLHTKFLPGVGARALEDHARGEQYTRVPAHDDYYEALSQAPDMWCESSVHYQGWKQLVDLGLMSHGDW